MLNICVYSGGCKILIIGINFNSVVKLRLIVYSNGVRLGRIEVGLYIYIWVIWFSYYFYDSSEYLYVIYYMNYNKSYDRCL